MLQRECRRLHRALAVLSCLREAAEGEIEVDLAEVAAVACDLIDKALYERISRIAAQAGYSSAEDFVVHVLEQQVRHLEEGKDEEEVKKRLQGLGYID